MQNWLQAEFAEECEWVIRDLTGMIFSCDQNGALTLLPHDLGTLVAAVDLLQRAQVKQFPTRPLKRKD
jgi:hypothetical protein